MKYTEKKENNNAGMIAIRALDLLNQPKIHQMRNINTGMITITVLDPLSQRETYRRIKAMNR